MVQGTTRRQHTDASINPHHRPGLITLTLTPRPALSLTVSMMPIVTLTLV